MAKAFRGQSSSQFLFSGPSKEMQPCETVDGPITRGGRIWIPYRYLFLYLLHSSSWRDSYAFIAFDRSRTRDSDSLHYPQQSIDALENLGKLWVHAGNIVSWLQTFFPNNDILNLVLSQTTQLRDFRSISHTFADLLDPSHLMDELDFDSGETMGSMLDYAIMGADPGKRPLPAKSNVNLTSPSWISGARVMGGLPGFDIPSATLLSSLTPSMRLEEVEQFLNCTPGPNNLV